MNATIFDNEKATAVENAVCSVFGCKAAEIVSIKDTLFKKVVVYILFKTENYKPRTLGLFYQVPYLYVPTIIAEMEHMEKVVSGFEAKINLIYESINRKKETRCA